MAALRPRCSCPIWGFRSIHIACPRSGIQFFTWGSIEPKWLYQVSLPTGRPTSDSACRLRLVTRVRRSRNKYFRRRWGTSTIFPATAEISTAEPSVSSVSAAKVKDALALLGRLSRLTIPGQGVPLCSGGLGFAIIHIRIHSQFFPYASNIKCCAWIQRTGLICRNSRRWNGSIGSHVCRSDLRGLDESGQILRSCACRRTFSIAVVIFCRPHTGYAFFDSH